MKTRQLRHFVAVAETLHFGRAAARLGMTQPPLSQSILQFEAELGAPLFARTKRTVSLTPFGEQFLGHARTALEGLDALPRIAEALRKGAAGRLGLSFISTADYNILPALIRRFSTLYPAVELVLAEATSEVQLATLLEGRGDAGIIVSPPPGSLDERLEFHPLLSEPLVAAVPETWIQEGRVRADRPLAFASLAAAPLIIFPRRAAPAFHDLIIGHFASNGATPTIMQEAVQMQTIISLVSAGIGMALVPASLRHLALAGVHYLDLEADGPRLESGLAWRRDRFGGALARLIAVAREVAAELDEPRTPSACR